MRLKKRLGWCLMPFRNKKLNVYIKIGTYIMYCMYIYIQLYTYIDLLYIYLFGKFMKLNMLIYNIQYLIASIDTYQPCIRLYWKQLNIQCMSKSMTTCVSICCSQGLQTISPKKNVTSRKKPRNTKLISSIYETPAFLSTRI